MGHILEGKCSFLRNIEYIYLYTVYRGREILPLLQASPLAVSTWSVAYTVSSYSQSAVWEEMASGFMNHWVIKKSHLFDKFTAGQWLELERGQQVTVSSSQHSPCAGTGVLWATPCQTVGWEVSEPWFHLFSDFASAATCPPQQFQFCFVRELTQKTFYFTASSAFRHMGGL